MHYCNRRCKHDSRTNKTSRGDSIGGGQRIIGVVDVQAFNLSSSSSIASGNTESKTLTPPAGHMYQLISMHLEVTAPGGAAAGTHDFLIQHGSEPTIVIKGESVFGTNLRFVINDWSLVTTKTPNDTALICKLMQEVWGTVDDPIDIKYENYTDVAQNNARNIRLVVKVWRIPSG